MYDVFDALSTSPLTKTAFLKPLRHELAKQWDTMSYDDDHGQQVLEKLLQVFATVP